MLFFTCSYYQIKVLLEIFIGQWSAILGLAYRVGRLAEIDLKPNMNSLTRKEENKS